MGFLPVGSFPLSHWSGTKVGKQMSIKKPLLKLSKGVFYNKSIRIYSARTMILL